MNKKLIGLVIVLALTLMVGGAMATGILTRSLSGTMSYNSLEGGFWTVIDTDGSQYIPINLSEDLMVEGLTVKFKVVERPEIIGIHMGGTYVEIIE